MKSKTLLIASMLFFSGVALGQFSAEVTINPDVVMTKAEKSAIGVDKMSPTQKDALKKFLQRYALLVANKLMESAQ